MERLENRRVLSGLPLSTGSPLEGSSQLDDAVTQWVAAFPGSSEEVAVDSLAAEPIALAPSAAAQSNSIPAPFWRKVGDEPTYAPDWYANQGAVTHELFYDTGLTAAQNGAALKTLLSNLSAGDHVRIHAGTYAVDSFFKIQANGTPEQPITIEGAAGEEVVITRSDASQNVVNLDQSQYLIIEGLTIRGGSTGLKVYSVDHFMLHDVEIEETAGNAIAANSANTSFLYFVDNDIHDTGDHGEGFYLGSNNGMYVTHDTYVVGNYVHDLDAPDVTQGDGIEIKDGSYAVTIQYNFIRNTNYPGITIYRTGRGIADRNVIEENVIIDSNDSGIQATADAVIRNNLIVTGNTGILSKSFGTDPQHLSIVNNTIVAGGDAVKTYNWGNSAAVDLLFANNAIYSASGRTMPNGSGNATVSANVVVSDLAATFEDLSLDGSGLDATPLAGSALIGTASTQYLPSGDLNGDDRITADDVGAVDFQGDQVAVGVQKFDFGSETSPVGLGYTQIAPSSQYDSSVGYGWQDGSIGYRDRGKADDLQRDFNFVSAGEMTFSADLPNGTYAISLLVGDRGYSHPDMSVAIEGSVVDTLPLIRNEFLSRTYTVNVTDGQLTLTLGQTNGGVALINALVIESVAGANAGIIVESATGLQTSEAGGAATFGVRLASQPTQDVAIGLASSDSGEGTLSTSQIVFTPANWDQTQSVTVTGVDDVTIDGDMEYTIVTSAAASLDPSYNGLNVADVSVVNLDNDVAESLYRFDFGGTSSPLEAGYTQITPSNRYTSSQGYGWQDGSIGYRDRGELDDLQRDFNFVSSGEMTFAADLPNGIYQVSLLVGDRGYSHPDMSIAFEGTVVDTLPLIANELLSRTYMIDVSDGQLTLTLGQESARFALINALVIEPVAGPNPAVIVEAAAGLQTSEAGGAATFGVHLASQPTQDVAIDLASSDSGEGTLSTSQIVFTPANWDQTQSVTVTGVDDVTIDGDMEYTIVTSAAASLDPSYNGLNVADVSVVNLDNDVAESLYRFDFGGTSSPLEAGYTQITPSNRYTSSQGYGWQDGSIGYRDRGELDDLQRDFNFVSSGEMTFAADLPNGIYQVSLLVGDRGYSHPDMSVSLEGIAYDTLSLSENEFLAKTYAVDVTDGQLTITLGQGDGQFAMINSLEIGRVD